MWEIPNPCLKENGETASPAEWEQQRERLKSILAEAFYGRMPEHTGKVTGVLREEKTLWDGEALFSVYDISCGPEGTVQFPAVLIRNPGKKGIPVCFFAGYVDEVIARQAVSRGYDIITILTDDCAPDTPDYQKGSLYRAYPDAGFKVIAMWAWLMMRTMDWLESTDLVDTGKFVSAGHSRYGKAALCLAVYDDRIKACAAGGSGCGGMGSLRIAGSRFGKDTGTVETLGGMTGGMFPHWYADDLPAYGAKEPGGHFRENELRFDADFVGAAIAPRPLMILEGLDDTWANPYGTLASWNAVSEVYAFLGHAEDCAIHFREGGHAFNLSDWAAMMDFMDERLIGKAGSGSLWHTRKPGEVRIERSWSLVQDEAPADTYDRSPEAMERLKKSLEERWAFGEAGLETGMVRFMKQILKQA
ncbi:MAG: hypothetical protein IIY77_07615 [Lachnospiraceae bacterium]|nr:hypothetical protein [Lachnospiraceae bacterium]